MGELKGEQVIDANPYVVQMDKFVKSLDKLSKVFLKLERKRNTFTKQELEEMYEKVSGKVCQNCENRGICLGENAFLTYQMLYEIFCTIEDYGVELNTEVKRKIQKRCIQAPRFLRESLEVFGAQNKICYGIIKWRRTGKGVRFSWIHLRR